MSRDDLPAWARERMKEPDAGVHGRRLLGRLIKHGGLIALVATGAVGPVALIGAGTVSEEVILQVLTAVAAAIGGSTIIKHLLTRGVNWVKAGPWQKLPAWFKTYVIPILIGVLTALSNGTELTDTLPVGALDDGVILGALASLIFKTVKPNRPVEEPASP